ncbi:unnamed protein product (mitochondrion) [Plasmodiophora brassicae]|uniref:phospholipase D n=1 Tax=Plasmodiophora brassicae TaxID=37360 RepID=A0A3P3YIQ8_PLABS|nr:unnamed protein product [Plasmodiophora brassicae]
MGNQGSALQDVGGGQARSKRSASVSEAENRANAAAVAAAAADSALSRRRSIPPTLPMGGITTEGHQHRTVYMWCSWCWKQCLHGRSQKNRLRRSVYQCLNCARRTLPCRWCTEAMARGHSDYDDVLCARCDGTIEKWGEVPAINRTIGHCSWCFDLTSHDLRMTNVVRRNSYMCEACGGRTALCISCRSAFTRCDQFYNDILCALCKGSIATWDDVEGNRRKSIAEGVKVLDHDDPYQSMYPLRRGQSVRALIDGKDCYMALADALDAAQETIYMSFWHMNPRIYLRRTPGQEFRISDRFDMIVQQRAMAGVKVYIILWRENVPAVVNNFSEEVATEMMSLHPNVTVIRHGPSPLLVKFCHHQKFVVVDQDIAFVGGFDIWKGVDYYNPHRLRPASIKSFFTDVIDRTMVPRMPWHDIDVELRGLAARDVARNFIERWNHHTNATKETALRIKSNDAPPLHPVSEGTCLVQVVRSMGTWSGASRLDKSIYGAYLHAVTSAEKYIYIENQYLSSSVAGGGVENVIVQRIINRVREKILAQEPFRVIIVLPQPEETGDSAMELLRWQYQTINRGGSSLLEQLHRAFPDVDLEQYVSFFFLRQWGRLGGAPVTEKVFVHSKLLIVDDRIALVASANFNDRSLLGDRDSELGVTVEDEDSFEISMDGKPWMVGRFPHELRLRLWAEHLGLKPDETARENTAIYEKVFPSIPQNCHRTMKIFKSANGLQVPAPAVTDGSELAGVRGTLTMHPIGFLLDEEISTKLSLVLGENISQ